jgi:hypothetical protein
MAANRGCVSMIAPSLSQAAGFHSAAADGRHSFTFFFTFFANSPFSE